MIKKTNSSVISWVTEALAKLGPGARTALPKLIVLLGKEPDHALCKTLVRIDPEGKECVPALISVLKANDYQVVEVAAGCLGLLGARASDAVPALAAALTREFGERFSNGYEPQASAARALRRMGPAARSAIPALIGALKFRDRVRPHAGGFNDVNEAGDESDCTGAAASAEVLGLFGAEAKGAVPALIEAVQRRERDDNNWLVRLKAIEALGRIGPDAKPAIPVLRGLMKEKQHNRQSLPVILAALYRLAPDGKELAEKWLDTPVKRSSTWTREPLLGRAMLMGVMGRTSVEADYLTRGTLSSINRLFASAGPEADDPPMPVAEWFERLGEFGVGGHKAIPRLREFQKHPSPWVRVWATEALEQITPKAIPVSFLPPSRADKTCPRGSD
jgi:HEAT repeat protein